MVKGWRRTVTRWAATRFRLIAGIALLAGLAVGFGGDLRAFAGVVDWSIDPLTLAGAIGLLAVSLPAGLKPAAFPWSDSQC